MDRRGREIETMTLGDYATLIRARWRTLVAVLVLCTAVAVALLPVLPRSYISRTTLFVGSAAPGDDMPSGGYEESELVLNQVQSYPPLVTSPEVLDPVIDSLELAVSPEQLRGQITAVNPPDTVLIAIEVTDSSPRQAQRISEAVAVNSARLIERLQAVSGPDEASTTFPIVVTTAVPSTLPKSAASPRASVVVALGLTVGFFLGCLAAVTRDRRNRRPAEVRELADLSSWSPLGVVAHTPQRDGKAVSLASRHSPAREDLRALRAVLRGPVGGAGSSARLMVLTAAHDGAGCSTLAQGVAVSMARTGLRTCLVLSDQRRGHRRGAAGAAERPGLNELLVGECELDEATTLVGELDVISPGRSQAGRDLLASERAASVFERLAEGFDVVVVDTAPLTESADAVELGRIAGGVVLVARHAVTTREQLGGAVARLAASGVPLRGSVLNDVPSP